jgi:hypothetical protein
MVSNQHELATASHEWHKNRWFCCLGSLIHENTVKRNRIKNISTGTNASTANDLGILELLHSLFVSARATVSTTTRLSIAVRGRRAIDTKAQ